MAIRRVHPSEALECEWSCVPVSYKADARHVSDS